MRLEIEARDIDEDEADDRILERPAVEGAHQPLAVGSALDVVEALGHAHHYGGRAVSDAGRAAGREG